MNQLEKLAAYVERLRYDDLPGSVKEQATYCVLDTCGASLGALTHPDVVRLTDVLSQWGGSSRYRAGIWGRGIAVDAHTAVLINAMAGHTLEMDDGHGRSKAHIGVVVVPAAWAMAEAVNASGKAFLEACVAGYEVMTRIGIGMDVASNRKRGWHTTGVIGPFGAAAAAAKLLNLNASQIADALGIAATQSAGLWAFLAEGANLKKLNPARAAVNGLEAAVLASAGMTGPRRALDAEDGGLYRAVSDAFDMDAVCSELGQRFEIMMIEKKLYPSCASTHHAVDAAVALYRKGVRPEDVQDVLIECSEVAYIQCGSAVYPRNWVEAKFSIPYTFAAALKHGTLTQESFTAERLDEPDVRALAARVRTAVNPRYTAVYPAKLMGKAVTRLKNATVISDEMDGMVGSPMKPIRPEDIEAKYMSLTAPVLGNEQAIRIKDLILNLAGREVIPSL